MISILINSYYYFIDWVFILASDSRYRLVVNHQGELLTYKSYQTLKGARIAFAQMYKQMAWKKGIKANWSHFYKAESDWLIDKIGSNQYAKHTLS